MLKKSTAFLFQNVIGIFYRWIYLLLRLYNQIRANLPEEVIKWSVKFFSKQKKNPKDISTSPVCEEKGCYYIESFINGKSGTEKAFLGNCGEEKAVSVARLLAKKSVRPLHIEDIITDMRF